ncbi:hypothetical protein BUALT_Bualt13G0080700 [Buddleja alternifolia]|uniref:Uncharacterized protein n=1 Tax=Buddleja alternifolia TaxID=168488 RepID=A0AAV6WTB7_9LAMI|nr:hypothetical protein BUALT_Bualt13G0080700 [Buddleja alternifolia]
MAMAEELEETQLARNRHDYQVTFDIDRMLDDLPIAPSHHSIYRASSHLRSISSKAYDPKIIAIGPFHRGKDHLQKMEHQKMQFLKLLLSSRRESSVDRYVTAIKDMEERARVCYAEPMTLGKHEFVLMLLLDGIFIVEFLRKYDNFFGNHQEMDEADAVFQFAPILPELLHDLMLFENQIPLFIVKELFELSLQLNDQREFVQLIWPFVELRESQLGSSEFQVSASLRGHNAPHLLGLVHYAKCLPLDQDLHSREDFRNGDMNIINCATELQEAGIIFEKATYERDTAKGNSFLDIEFKNCTMRIPTFVVSYETESWFRNMIAYENDFPRRRQKYMMDYIFVMHCLIQSPTDVQLLRHRGIISSWTGEDETVYHLIKQLENKIHISDKFSYAHVFLGANSHCQHRRNKWMARWNKWMTRWDKWMTINIPWKFISFFAAVTHLLLTAAQTMVAFLSYHSSIWHEMLNRLKRHGHSESYNYALFVLSFGVRHSVGRGGTLLRRRLWAWSAMTICRDGSAASESEKSWQWGERITAVVVLHGGRNNGGGGPTTARRQRRMKNNW